MAEPQRGAGTPLAWFRPHIRKCPITIHAMPSPSLIPPTLPLAAPKSLADLFWSFTWLALQGFGGVLAVVQRELVDKKRWMTNDEFIEDWAVAQILPGPNVVNLSMMIGDHKIKAVEKSGAEKVVTSCPGCMLQLSDLAAPAARCCPAAAHMLRRYCPPTANSASVI